jgi:hypothetical protein
MRTWEKIVISFVIVIFVYSYAAGFSTVSADLDFNATFAIVYIGPPSSITMSYSIVGGGTGFGPPTLTYTYGGTQCTTTLSSSPNTYNMDPGTVWSINNPTNASSWATSWLSSQVLSGSSGTEIWSTKQGTNGEAEEGENQTINFVYYHQYLINLGYSVFGTGAGPSPPDVTVTQFGASAPLYPPLSSVMTPTSVFVDAGSQYSFQNPLPWWTDNERWFTESSPQGVVSSSFSVQPVYYHQYTLWVFYTCMECYISPGTTTVNNTLSAAPPPILTGTSFGSTLSTQLPLGGGTIWLDEGSTFNLSNPLPGSSSTERWYSLVTGTSDITNGSMNGPVMITPSYDQQFYVEIKPNSAAGGSVTPASGWFSQVVQILATANPGWQFENWNGSGTASFSGTWNYGTLLLNSPDVINSPIVEYATFYPGLTINTNYGTVTYSYSLGSGSVPSNTSEVLYVPLDANVSLTANPSFYIFQFKQWSGATNSTAQQISIIVSAPTVVQANFDFNWLNIGITIAVIAGGLAIFTGLILQRRGKRTRNTVDQALSGAPGT